MELDSLYQEVILDHYRNPRNRVSLDHLDCHVHENPSCGDSVKVDVQVEGGIVTSVVFDIKGCAISTASASMMTELLIGKEELEARALIRTFLMVMRAEAPADLLDSLGELSCFKSVMRFAVRVKCATLAWHAVNDRLAPHGTPVAAAHGS